LLSTGRDFVWCVYPVSNGFDYEVKSVTIPEDFAASKHKLVNTLSGLSVMFNTSMQKF
jgi:hypothetical protein